MASKLDELKWNLYLKKKRILFEYGIKKGLIHCYDSKFIENLRHVYYGGVLASILLLSKNMCGGFCYDRALLATFGFGDDDFRMVDADIDGITLNPKYVDFYSDAHYGNHCFVERTMKDGSVWVYDTTMGLVFDKNLYYLLERPQITKINDKKKVLDYLEYQEIKNANIEKDKYVLPLLLPIIEKVAKNGNELYQNFLLDEIERFKKDIDYDDICKEVDDDMMVNKLRL